MTGMTPERLAEIRERAEVKRWDYLDETEADRADLLAEVVRLRTGIEALADEWQRIPSDGGYEAACEDHAREAVALLNPTEQAGSES